MNKKAFETIISAEIFCDADKKNLSEIFESHEAVIKEYKNDDVIFSVENFSYEVGIIMKGSARVIKKETGVLMSTLEEGDIFGCASLFSGRDYYVNNIIAVKDCKVIFIDKETVEAIMISDHGFSLSFIRYLSDRLYYLNTRILTFTGSSVESRVANYLYGCFKRIGDDSINLSLSKLAFSVDVARASLYRALDKLSEGGAIEKNGKTIKLVNEHKLKEFMHQNN